jgi:membrane protein
MRPLWNTTVYLINQFRSLHLGDWAAALTYYAMLAVFPAFLVIVALFGLLGTYPQTSNAILNLIGQIGPHSAISAFRGPVEGVIKNRGGAGALLGFGLLFSLYSASNYIASFSRAVGVVRGVRDERPYWRTRPIHLFLALSFVFLFVAVTIVILFTGPLARDLGNTLGINSDILDAWSVAKWPALFLLMTAMVTLLYRSILRARSTEIKQLSLRLVPGALLAVILWLLASALLAAYAASFPAFNKTYGSIGGIIAFLIWLWLANAALMLGATINARSEKTIATKSLPR